MKSGVRIGLFSVLALIAILITYLILSPYWALHQIKQAVIAQDAAKLSSYVDYPQLRQSLKMQLEVAVTQEIRKMGDDNPFALLGAKFVNQVLDTGVEQLVQPQFLPFLLKGISIEAAQSQQQKTAASTVKVDQFDYTLNYQNWSQVRVEVFTDQQPQTAFELARQGMSWKIVNVQLPKRP